MSCCTADSTIIIKRAMSYDVCFKMTDDEGEDYFLQNGEKLIFTVKKVKELDAQPIIQKVWTSNDYIDDNTLRLYLTDEETDIDYGLYYYEFSRLVDGQHKPTNNSGRFEIARTAAQKVGD